MAGPADAAARGAGGGVGHRSRSWNRWPSSGPAEPFGDAATCHRVVADLVATRTIVDAGRAAPAADVVAAVPDHVTPALETSGDRGWVADGVAAVLARGTGADLQRRVDRDTGDLAAVVGAAVRLTPGE